MRLCLQYIIVLTLRFVFTLMSTFSGSTFELNGRNCYFAETIIDIIVLRDIRLDVILLALLKYILLKNYSLIYERKLFL